MPDELRDYLNESREAVGRASCPEQAEAAAAALMEARMLAALHGV